MTGIRVLDLARAGSALLEPARTPPRRRDQHPSRPARRPIHRRRHDAGRGEAGGPARLRGCRADEGNLSRSAWTAARRRAQAGLPVRDAGCCNRNRGFALTAVLVLGIGIGVNNMLFTILNAHTLRGLPMPSSDRVLWLSTIDDRGRDRGVSFADYQDITAGVQHYAGIAAFESGPMVIAGDGRAADRLDGAYVTANAFDLIGTTPLLGRGSAPSDDQPGAAGVAVLTQDGMGDAVRFRSRGSRPGGHRQRRTGHPDRRPAGSIRFPQHRTDLDAVVSGAEPCRPEAGCPHVAGVRPGADGARVDQAIAEVTGIGERLASEHPGDEPEHTRQGGPDQRAGSSAARPMACGARSSRSASSWC